ncbi:DUF4058 family protein [Sphaerospermopsis kisseleviana CS-549]|uniref:DUF4058 family protein n=1 Tax=Sphaerospermopsis kisseleviana CS-549 TaxID=3021783 RepID=A0ABT4ZL47_9CYAN|nr:DUF4058 family protein [Sphaerospermopsis kisseleviana]MDB9440044.1 DUF4058 family protein [Sphaerospermopsis kisseleviana CS-549]BAZ83526.1 hypothetical protein NIES73_48150 [Sphaerospermopsis kisseleviana NIES-73]
MRNPFPGMNPYLEQPELWHQVHNRLIVAIADDLTPQIAPKYRVSIEERVYTSVDDISLVGIADVAVAKRNNNVETGTTLTTTKLAEPSKVKVPMYEEVIERFLEVKATKSREVVTVIKILSPKNKRSKEGRTVYENKRQKILASATNLVEIDLLRLGESLPILGATKSDYNILVSRSHQRPDADLYSFDLQDSIPIFPVPLRLGENEPVIDLNRLLNEIYERARFDLAIDYSQVLKPGLSSDQEVWVREILEKNSI